MANPQWMSQMRILDEPSCWRFDQKGTLWFGHWIELGKGGGLWRGGWLRGEKWWGWLYPFSLLLVLEREGKWWWWWWWFGRGEARWNMAVSHSWPFWVAVQQNKFLANLTILKYSPHWPSLSAHYVSRLKYGIVCTVLWLLDVLGESDGGMWGLWWWEWLTKLIRCQLSWLDVMLYMRDQKENVDGPMMCSYPRDISEWGIWWRFVRGWKIWCGDKSLFAVVLIIMKLFYTMADMCTVIDVERWRIGRGRGIILLRRAMWSDWPLSFTMSLIPTANGIYAKPF